MATRRVLLVVLTAAASAVAVSATEEQCRVDCDSDGRTPTRPWHEEVRGA